MAKQEKMDTTVPKLPAELELTISEIIQINVACAAVQEVTGLPQKAAYDIARLSDDSERIVTRTQKEAKKKDDALRKAKKTEDVIMKEMVEFMDGYNTLKEKIRIPALKMSDLVASRDLKLYDLKEGDMLVPVKFLKVMGKYIENDKNL